MTAGLIVVIVLGALGGVAVGKAYARAMRAYRDLMATKKAISGLFRRVVGEWLTVVKVTAVVTLGLVVVFAAGVWTAVR